MALCFTRFKTKASSTANYQDVQTEPPYLLPTLASKRPADVLILCNKSFKISTSETDVQEATKIAFDFTCIGPPPSCSSVLPESMDNFKHTRNSFAPSYYTHLSQAEHRKRTMKHEGPSGSTIAALLASHNIAFLPFAVDSFGGMGPSASMFLYGSAFPNIRSSDWSDSTGNRTILLSDADYDSFSWIKNDKDKYQPPFFPAALLNQFGQINTHVSTLRKTGEDNAPYARYRGTPAQFEQRRLSSVIATGSGNALTLFAHAISNIVGKGSHSYSRHAYAPHTFNSIEAANTVLQRLDTTYPEHMSNVDIRSKTANDFLGKSLNTDTSFRPSQLSSISLVTGVLIPNCLLHGRFQIIFRSIKTSQFQAWMEGWSLKEVEVI